MPLEDIYENYFDIDPGFQPIMTEDLINETEDAWKGFYPHDTFVTLLQSAVDVLRRHKKKSIWVTGSYGTGKSHAVLTLKKMLEAEKDSLEDYFKKHEDKLSKQLLNEFNALKNTTQQIITVYHYGSSDIRTTSEFAHIIQSDIKRELKKAGIDTTSTLSLKDSIIELFKDPAFADYTDKKISEKYSSLFSPYETTTDLLQGLETGSNEEALDIVRKVLRFQEDDGRFNIKITAKELINWIDEVIKQNNLKGIFFIWDEFTEFFKNNANNLTDFQNIVETTADIPFVLTIVTHISGGQLGLADEKKLKDRFQDIIEISLPDNMAFQLMASALTVKEGMEDDWDELKDDVWSNVQQIAHEISVNAKHLISEEDFKRILPFHPSAALVLKHLSHLYNSNQRSMFEYIKENPSSSSTYNFKSFIHEVGPYSPNPYLTCDYIWNYFFGGTNPKLAKELSDVYYLYARAEANKSLNEEAKSVLKTVLLFNGLSKHASHVSILRPTHFNICHAFDGTKITWFAVEQHLNNLVGLGLLSQSITGKNEREYLALGGGANLTEIETLKKTVKLSPLQILSKEQLTSNFKLKNGLDLRYKYEESFADMETMPKVKHMLSTHDSSEIPLMFVFAKNNADAAKFSEELKKPNFYERNEDLVIIDLTATPLTDQEYEGILEAKANEIYYTNKQDAQQRDQYQKRLAQLAGEWLSRILHNSIRIISQKYCPEPITLRDWESTKNSLYSLNKGLYSDGIEELSSNTVVFQAKNLKSSVKLGCTQKKFSGIFSKMGNNPELVKVWNDDNYWKNYPDHLISRIKIRLDGLIQKEFDEKGKIQFETIWEFVTAKPYGFLPCDLSAFVLGFLLKEYVVAEYTWSNTSTAEPMSPEKLAEMVEAVIKKSKNKSLNYIVKMSDEEKSFISSSAVVFNINPELCQSLEGTKNAVASAISKLSYPLWALKSCVKSEMFTNPEEVQKVIDAYCALPRASSENQNELKNIVEDVGRIFRAHQGFDRNLQDFFTPEKTSKGMDLYLQEKFPELIQNAQALGLDSSTYLQDVKAKLSADASWLWSDEHVGEKIQNLALEYRVCVLGNKYVSAKSFNAAKRGWRELLQKSRLPAEVIAHQRPELAEAVEQLELIFFRNSITSSVSEYLSVLEIHGGNLPSILSEYFQREIFVEYCTETYDNDVDEEYYNKIYDSLPENQLSIPKADFDSITNSKLSSLRCHKLEGRLKNIWRNKTDTDSPHEWSEIHLFPIALIFDATERRKAQDYFQLFKKSSTNETQLNEAITFLEKPIFNKLTDDAYVSQLFNEKIVGKYCSLLNESAIQDLKLYLSKNLGEDVYNWVYTMDVVKSYVQEYAEKFYSKEGFKTVFSRIDSMSAEDAKTYLKDLIQSHVDVGLAIMNKPQKKE